MSRIGSEFGPKGRFHLEKRLRIDPFGETYIATDRETSERVVLRLLPSEVETRVVLRARIAAEMAHQADLELPAVGTFLGSTEDNGIFAVYRAFIDAPSLRETLEQQEAGLPVETGLLLFDRILSVLQRAHEHGLTHLGLAPEQIFLVGSEPDWTPHATDFGLPRLVGHRAFGQARRDRPYLAPEQKTEAPLPDTRADVYALGALLASILTGDMSDLRGTRAPKAMDPAARPSPELVRLIHGAMTNDPSRRYASAQAFRVSLRERLADSPLPPLGDDQPEERGIVLSSRELEALSAAEIEALDGVAASGTQKPAREDALTPTALPVASDGTSPERAELTPASATSVFSDGTPSGLELPPVDAWFDALSAARPDKEAVDRTPPGPLSTREDEVRRAPVGRPTSDQKEVIGIGALAQAMPPSEEAEAIETELQARAEASPTTAEERAQPTPPYPAATATPRAPDRASDANRDLQKVRRVGPEAGRHLALVLGVGLLCLAVGGLAGYLVGTRALTGGPLAPLEHPRVEALGSAASTADAEPLAPLPVEAPSPPAETVVIAETRPAQTPHQGPLVFGRSLWEPGNTWIFLYQREVPEDSPEFLNLEYYFRRRVEEASPDEWGTRVLFVDDGGITGPRTQELIASASCLFEASNRSALLCLPADASGLRPLDIADTSMNVIETQIGEASVRFDPVLGWAGSTETERDGQRFHTRLVGLRVGEVSAGEADRRPPTCDWDLTLDRAERIGSANRPRTPELRQARDWGLRRTVRRFDVPLSGSYGPAHLAAWRDDDRTVYALSQEPLGAGDVPEDTQDIETVALALDEVKTFNTPDGAAEYVAMVFESDDQAMVRLLRIGAASQVQAHTLLPETRDEGLNVVLLASTNGCYVQVRNGRREERRYANFELNPEGVACAAGDLPEE